MKGLAQYVYFGVLKYKRILIFKIEKSLIPFATKSPFLSSLYYLVFNSKFRREQQSVLTGRYHFEKQFQTGKPVFSLLRRNIHRIEKGLTIKNGKKIFAEDYIVETVVSYIYEKKYAKDQNSLKWAFDVLESYFNSVEHTKNVTSAYSIFLKNADDREKDLLKCIPYKRKDNEINTISFNEFLGLCTQRRSVRWYLQKKVPRTLVEQAIMAAMLAPSACNRQAFRFEVVDDLELLKSVTSLPAGADVFASNIPMMVFVIGDLSAYFDERDRHLIYIDGALSTMLFTLALETLGLASCTINWADIESKEHLFEKTFNTRKHERCIMSISLGYPDPEGLIPYSQKRDSSLLINYNNVHSNR